MDQLVATLREDNMGPAVMAAQAPPAQVPARRLDPSGRFGAWACEWDTFTPLRRLAANDDFDFLFTSHGHQSRRAPLNSKPLVAVIPPGMAFTPPRDGTTKLLQVVLPRHAVETVAFEEFGWSPDALRFDSVILCEDEATRSFAALADLARPGPFANSATYRDRYVQMLAAHFLAVHVPVSGRDSRRRPGLSADQRRQVLALIERQLGGALTIDVMAEAANLSPFHFARAFKDSFGVSPHQFVLRRRIERGCELLQSGILSIAQIALETGFSSQSHFTSTFKRFKNITPARYRRAFG